MYIVHPLWRMAYGLSEKKTNIVAVSATAADAAAASNPKCSQISSENLLLDTKRMLPLYANG